MLEEDLHKELNRCLGCKVMPCAKACPLGVSPHDFIIAAKNGDFTSAAANIATRNPLPQTCGLVCPDLFCQKACIRARIDKSIQIPCLQAEIIRRGGLPLLALPPANNKKVAIIGGGPAGIGALYELLLNGYHVDIYEKTSALGGAARLIPERRLPKNILDNEIARLTNNNRVQIFYNTEITDFQSIQKQYDGVILSLGEPIAHTLGIVGEEYCISYQDYLSDPQKYNNSMTKVAVVGGGEVALDCALTLKEQGVNEVHMFVRRRLEDMRIQKRGFDELKEAGVSIRPLTSISQICLENNCYTLTTVANTIENGRAVRCEGSECALDGYDNIVMALGSYFPKDNLPSDMLIAGDMTGSTGTIVEALASGRAVAKQLMERHIIL